MQPAPQLPTADGEATTVPDPLPEFDTFNCCVGVAVNEAPTAIEDVATLIVHVPVPGHVAALPLTVQPENVSPAVVGVAVKVTELPLSNDAEQVDPQLIAAGLLVTVPEPAPDGEIVTLILAGTKFAVTDCAELIVTVQVVDVPEHAPLQPANTEVTEPVDVGEAVSVTIVP